MGGAHCYLAKKRTDVNNKPLLWRIELSCRRMLRLQYTVLTLASAMHFIHSANFAPLLPFRLFNSTLALLSHLAVTQIASVKLLFLENYSFVSLLPHDSLG